MYFPLVLSLWAGEREGSGGTFFSSESHIDLHRRGSLRGTVGTGYMLV